MASSVPSAAHGEFRVSASRMASSVPAKHVCCCRCYRLTSHHIKYLCFSSKSESLVCISHLCMGKRHTRSAEKQRERAAKKVIHNNERLITSVRVKEEESNTRLVPLAETAHPRSKWWTHWGVVWRLPNDREDRAHIRARQGHGRVHRKRAWFGPW